MKKYEFLVSDGNGAASRGMSVDNYSTYRIEAENDKEAYNKLLIEMKGYDSVEEYVLDYYHGVESESEIEDEDELADYHREVKEFDGKEELDNMDISGGDPWVEGLKIDGKVTIEPDLENMEYYGYEFSDESYFDWDLPGYSDKTLGQYDDDEDDEYYDEDEDEEE